MHHDSRTRPRDEVALRDLEAADLPALFAQQSDPEACRIAAVHPREQEAFDRHWASALNDPAIVTKAIVEQGMLVGHICCFKVDGEDSVGYWIAKEHWGRGIATDALALFLKQVKTRPIHARVARQNPASIRVLERNGFLLGGYQWSPGPERFIACEEALLVLE
jgi:RimJ/RimL family protein N-acetyltransferase